MARRGCIVIALVAGLSGILASPAGAVVIRTSSGQIFGVTPRAGVSMPSSVTLAPAPPAATDASRVDYNGGVVLHSSSPYLVFWDPASAIPPSSQGVIGQYLADVAADSGRSTNVYSVLRQYTDMTGFANYEQRFSSRQIVIDRRDYPSAGSCPTTGAAYPTCITDAQVREELTRLIARRHLPTGTGPGAPVYFVITPQDVNICFESSGTACSSNAFCAYHSFYNLRSGVPVVYSLVPFFVFQAGPKGCQTDGTPVYQTPHGSGDHGYQIADNLSHELSESITDPTFGGYFNIKTGLEVGDLCATFGPTPDPVHGLSPLAYAPTLGGNAEAGTLFDQLINGNQYYNQTEWSNGDKNCRAQTSSGVISPAFSATHATAEGAVSFDPAGTTSTAGYSSSTWEFGDGSAPAFSRAGPSALSHRYPHSGGYQVTLTVVDQVGNVGKATRSVFVN